MPVKKKSVVRSQSSLRKSVNIERISNGYIVSQYNDRTMKDTKKFARSKIEAKNVATRML